MSLIVRNDDKGELDEVVGFGAFHLEQMHAGHWFLNFEDAVTGKMLAVHLSTKRGKIGASCEERQPCLPIGSLAEAAGIDGEPK